MVFGKCVVFGNSMDPLNTMNVLVFIVLALEDGDFYQITKTINKDNGLSGLSLLQVSINQYTQSKGYICT